MHGCWEVVSLLEVEKLGNLKVIYGPLPLRGTVELQSLWLPFWQEDFCLIHVPTTKLPTDRPSSETKPMRLASWTFILQSYELDEPLFSLMGW